MKAQYTKLSRHRLKAHDQGHNRHNKGTAYADKVGRLADEHKRVTGMRRKPKKRGNSAAA